VDAIKVSGLVKKYGALRAVDGISFNVEGGEVFGMLGPNGAGKTTTVELLIGLRNRDAGDIRVVGLDPQKEPDKVKAQIGVQLQNPSLYPRLTVSEIVMLFKTFYPKPLQPDAVIERVGLSDKRKAFTGTLSGGQRQRLAVALAMLSNGKILFLDEPTTGLDPQARRGLWDVITALKEEGKTVFLTTHYMEEAERLCDRVAVVDQGKIIALGSPKDLITQHFKERAIEFKTLAKNGKETYQKIAGTSRVQISDDVITLYTENVSVTVADLLDHGEREGYDIDDVTVRYATLEDVFLKLTGRRIRE
jgi:ABC-2 type transport system ATP-binding protein